MSFFLALANKKGVRSHDRLWDSEGGLAMNPSLGVAHHSEHAQVFHEDQIPAPAAGRDYTYVTHTFTVDLANVQIDTLKYV